MEDPSILFGLAGMAAAGVGLASAAMLKAWRQWLELRRVETSRGPRRDGPCGAGLAELRRRVRRLEAIAEGIDI